ncbi:MAG TPA: nucleotidyltransferase family protein [Gaiellaceae bacterium]|nr:nucleotidyltransferase family protein [Gaiellaceae bacterium]
MKAIVLAAGYATRLYPLTLDQPKHLLEVGGRTILERLLGQLAEVEGLDLVYVVTNDKFADRFRDFASSWRGPFSLAVVDDGTTTDDDKLGAIGDLGLVIRQEVIDDDLLVAAGDSIFDDSRLDDFAKLGLAKDAPVTAVIDVGDLGAVKRYSAITADADGRIIAFEEKPEQPETTLAGIALYFYPRSVLTQIDLYLAEGNNADQPGRLVEWMFKRTPFYVWRVPGRWYDIGSPETLEQADREFSQS